MPRAKYIIMVVHFQDDIIIFELFKLVGCSEYFRYRTRVNNVIAPAIIIAAIASILGSTAIGCCAFMKLTVSFTLTDHPEAGQLRFTRNVGLWSYEGHKSLDDSDDTTCYEYPDRLEEDPSWKVGYDAVDYFFKLLFVLLFDFN